MATEMAEIMMVTCPACGRNFPAPEDAEEVECLCSTRFDPATKPTVVDPFLGREVSGYRIEEIVGRGGMGTVYRAIQLSLGRSVAFKVLPAAFKDDRQFLSRFHREAEVLASLSHPNVVQVIERGEVDGRCYLVMEYIDGGSLRRLLHKGALPLDQAVSIFGRLLDGLSYAHGQGVVHRDIKPENVLLTRDGDVKVVDFGLSRVLGREEVSRLTHTHMVMGTYEYIAPELREGSRHATELSDLYSTAVVLYEALTGELPMGRFELPDSNARVRKLLDRALSKDPARRYASAAEMASELRDCLSKRPVRTDDLKQRIAQAATKTADVATEVAADTAKFARQAASKAKAASQKARRAYQGWKGSPSHTWLARTWRRILGREPGPAPVPAAPATSVRGPARFESNYDLLITMLSVTGILFVVGGVALLLSGQGVELGLIDLRPATAGVIVSLYGFFLTIAADRARNYRRLPRLLLLALSGLLLATGVGAPIALLVWWQLQRHDMRVYLNARAGGMSSARAAAVAQNLPPPLDTDTDLLDAQRQPSRAFGVMRALMWTAALAALGSLLILMFG